MTLALGIDTGGTYTDVALVDYVSGRLLRSGKALTTKHDLAVGIATAMSQVLGQDRDRIGLVSLSTTLATNAIVEGKGAPFCALLIGYQGRVAERTPWEQLLGTRHYVMVGGGHEATGEPSSALDEAALRAGILEHASEVEAFAISGFFGTRNPSHEQRAAALVQELTGLPVTCGHELTHRLDALRRASTVCLNARLIPLLRELIEAVLRTIHGQGIRAPLMVVKGDGSLMDAQMALRRPVETILAGPAASVVGAQHLAGGGDVVVADMGGTTTDIAMLHDGQPKLDPKGARVGGWHTMVEAVEVHTVGLGGDSRVWLTDRDDLALGPERILPLCMLAARWPAVTAELERQARPERAISPNDGEFLTLQRDYQGRIEAIPAPVRKLLEIISDHPLSLDQAYRVLEQPLLYTSALRALEREGVLLRSGLTPTDAAHCLGLYDAWDRHAAELGTGIFGRRLGADARSLAKRVLSLTSQRIAREIVLALVPHNGDGISLNHIEEHMLAEAIAPTPGAPLSYTIALRPRLVALGAPVRTYFGQVRELLNSDLVIPNGTEVANAIGAVAGSVVQDVHARIVPLEEQDGFRVHLADGVHVLQTRALAEQFAQDRVRAAARAQAEAAGAVDVEVQLTVQEHSVPVTETWGDMLYLGTTMTARAVGRPRLAGR
ncbi:MAG: hydantoinase/oxoprolinase family protein [Anaerolineae bacterium]|nr:hydantoinase/oxoprolinase family protein [Anaerolineae bacterium]